MTTPEKTARKGVSRPSSPSLTQHPARVKTSSSLTCPASIGLCHLAPETANVPRKVGLFLQTTREPAYNTKSPNPSRQNFRLEDTNQCLSVAAGRISKLFSRAIKVKSEHFSRTLRSPKTIAMRGEAQRAAPQGPISPAPHTKPSRGRGCKILNHKTINSHMENASKACLYGRYHNFFQTTASRCAY